MPKMKTHSGAAKRFKMTGTGKLRRAAGDPQAHVREEAVARAPAASRARSSVTRGDAAPIKRLLGER